MIERTSLQSLKTFEREYCEHFANTLGNSDVIGKLFERQSYQRSLKERKVSLSVMCIKETKVVANSLCKEIFTSEAIWAWILLSDCPPQSCKSCSCPAMRLKKDPRDSNRDINGSTDRGLLHVQINVLEQHPTMSGRQQKDTAAVFTLGGKEAPIYRGDGCQVGSSVIKETSSWHRGKQAGSHWLSPTIKRIGESEQGVGEAGTG